MSAVLAMNEYVTWFGGVAFGVGISLVVGSFLDARRRDG